MDDSERTIEANASVGQTIINDDDSLTNAWRYEAETSVSRTTASGATGSTMHMDLTPTYGSTSRAQPSMSRWIAAVHPTQKSLIVRSSTRLAIKRVIPLCSAQNNTSFDCEQPLTLLWFADDLLLVADRKTVLVSSVLDDKFSARITQDALDIGQVAFDPCGASVLIWADLLPQLSVWNLHANTGTVYPQVKLNNPRGVSFRPSDEAAHVALLTQHDAKDTIEVFSTQFSSWRPVRQWTLLPISDCTGIAWSPSGRLLAACSDAMTFAIAFYLPDGELIHSFSLTDEVLGIKTMRWIEAVSTANVTGRRELLSLGGYGSQVRLIGTEVFTPILQLNHRESVRINGGTVWREILAESSNESIYDTCSQPAAIPKESVGSATPRNRMGIGCMAMNRSGTVLATRDDSMPCCLWIWSLQSLEPISVIINIEPIRTVRWCPYDDDLLLFTGCRPVPDGGITRAAATSHEPLSLQYSLRQSVLPQRQDQSTLKPGRIYVWSQRLQEPHVFYIPRAQQFNLQYCDWLPQSQEQQQHRQGNSVFRKNEDTNAIKNLAEHYRNCDIEDQDEPAEQGAGLIFGDSSGFMLAYIMDDSDETRVV